jgi:hypothetical protein
MSGSSVLRCGIHGTQIWFNITILKDTELNVLSLIFSSKNSKDREFRQYILLFIDYLQFYVPLKNISLIWRCHHCRWRAAKFRPMFDAQGLWAGRDLYRATLAVTRGLGFFGLIRRTAPFSRLYDIWGDVEDQFYPESSGVPIQLPIMTHKGVWRTYSSPDPHGYNPLFS